MAHGRNSNDKQNSLICANILLSRFADVNQANHEGQTPLLVALEQGNTNLHLIALLLHYGADIYQENKHGRSALSVAIESKNTKILKLLLTDRSLPPWAEEAMNLALTEEERWEVLEVASSVPSLYNLSRLAVVKDLQNREILDQSEEEKDLIYQLLTKGDDYILETVAKYPRTIFTSRGRAPIAR